MEWRDTRSLDLHEDESPWALNRDQEATDSNCDEECPAFSTVDEVAKKLRVNRKTVYEAIARGEIPAVRIGRALRVPSAWLRRGAA